MAIQKVSKGLLILGLMVCLASVPALAGEEFQWAETWQEGVIYKLEEQIPIGWHQDDDAQFNPCKGVKKLPLRHAENTLDISFFVIGDPHFTAEYNIIAHNDTHYYLKNPALPALRAVSNNINTTCNWFKEHGLPGCIGGVSVGDMTRNGTDGFLPHHSVYYYRCLYDYDSDCNEDQKSHALNRYKIKYPVFPTLGNHDDPTEFEHAGAIRDYIRNRVNHSLALFQAEGVENYYKGNGSDIYAWEWGSFHFINMGLWAFYDKKDKEDGNRATVDPQKISWLQRHLGAIGKEKAIILFQHFGWDTFSFNGDWWSRDNAKLLIDLICDREVKVGGSTACDNPYNVVAIFTGHNHEWGYGSDILYGQGPRKIPNYQVDDAGHDLQNNKGQSGYFHVRLNMKDGHLDAEGNFVGKMEVNQIKLTPASDPKDEEHIVDLHRTVEAVVPARDITTEFLRFDQGEPSCDWHCAEIKPNGRYNDIDCANEKYLICYDPDGEKWRISNYKHTWSEGFEMCCKSGWEFTEPKTVEDQRDIIQLMADTGRSPAWVNCTYQLRPDFDVKTGGKPLEVKFTDKTAGHVYSWEWDFNNDGIVDSTLQNPTHNYTASGSYDVTLTVNSSFFNSCSKYTRSINAPVGDDDHQPPICNDAWTDPCNPFEIPGWFGAQSQGGGISAGDIDGNGTLDLIALHIDNPSGGNRGYYRIGWDVDSAGTVSSWTDPHPIPGWFGAESQGGGISAGDIDGNGTLDLIALHIDHPSGGNHGYYRIGWNVDSAGRICSICFSP